MIFCSCVLKNLFSVSVCVYVMSVWVIGDFGFKVLVVRVIWVFSIGLINLIVWILLFVGLFIGIVYS